MERNSLDFALNSRQQVEKNIMKAFGEQPSEAGQVLEKSHVADMLGHQGGPIQIKKRGREIKEKVLPIFEHEKEMLLKAEATIAALKTQIGCEPTEDCNVYKLKEWKDAIGEVPKVYGWKQVEDAYPAKMQAEVEIGSVTVTDTKEGDNSKCRLMDEYNEQVRIVVNCKIDLAMMNTLLTGIEDTKMYDLPVETASKLGF